MARLSLNTKGKLPVGGENTDFPFVWMVEVFEVGNGGGCPAASTAYGVPVMLAEEISLVVSRLEEVVGSGDSKQLLNPDISG